MLAVASATDSARAFHSTSSRARQNIVFAVVGGRLAHVPFRGFPLVPFEVNGQIVTPILHCSDDTMLILASIQQRLYVPMCTTAK